MPLSTFSAELAGISLCAGLLGAITGLGGGVVIVPALLLLFHIDIHYAIGASLVSVIATSSGSAIAYVRQGLSNVRIGMFLEVATTAGALFGAYLTAKVSTQWIGLLFGVLLLWSGYTTLRQRGGDHASATSSDAIANRLRLSGIMPSPDGEVAYQADHSLGGFGLMFVAGTASGLLGIGSGALKVLALDQVMKLPFKVSTTTSNFMIGVTAAAGAGIYLSRGYIVPVVAAPVTLGVLAGSLLGVKLLNHLRLGVLKVTFACVVLALGAEMLLRSIKGPL